MTSDFLLRLLGVALLVGLTIALCQWAHHRLPQCRLAPGDGHRVRNRYRNVAANIGTALAVYAAGLALFGDFLLDPGRPSRWWTPLAILLAYDSGYYWVHRALHWRPLMRHIHWVHHRMIHPTAVDSLYLHPAETAMGLAVQLGAVALFGPLGLGAFLAVSLLHAVINVLDHANLVLPWRLAWLSNHWSARHDLHHSKGGNFASITPFWDWLFGTAAR
ncbi:MAG: sterol desaturase family protein [Acidobacteria bacterium]|nr:sterol desaturase family protein [Acidobacteriota bacterium]